MNTLNFTTLHTDQSSAIACSLQNTLLRAAGYSVSHGLGSGLVMRDRDGALLQRHIILEHIESELRAIAELRRQARVWQERSETQREMKDEYAASSLESFAKSRTCEADRRAALIGQPTSEELATPTSPRIEQLRVREQAADKRSCACAARSVDENATADQLEQQANEHEEEAMRLKVLEGITAADKEAL